MQKKSLKLYNEAKKYLVGGVNSPIRAFGKVGGNPLFVKSAKGSKIIDVDGNEYLDYVGSFGAMILGHAHPQVVSDATKAIAKGSSFGVSTELEMGLAKEICAAFPSVDLIRLTNSGTEAVMGALKLAKAFTKRNKVIKFRECYHGWSEQQYLEAEFNDLKSIGRLLSNDVAAVIVEPVAGNLGVIPPASGFLEGLRRVCDKNNTLLIFDEVITGFRIAYGGAQEFYKVKADLTCFGKIIGGGLPVGAFGGRREIMELLAPKGFVYQAGTFSGNPVTVMAGLSTLKMLKNKKLYADLEEKSRTLTESLEIKINRVGSMFGFRVNNYPGFFREMMKQGVYFAPSKRETNFISSAHSCEDIENTIKAVNGGKYGNKL